MEEFAKRRRTSASNNGYEAEALGATALCTGRSPGLQSARAASAVARRARQAGLQGAPSEHVPTADESMYVQLLRASVMPGPSSGAGLAEMAPRSQK